MTETQNIQYGTFTTDDAEAISQDIAGMFEELTGVALNIEQFEAFAIRVLPYLGEVDQDTAHKAWDAGHLAGMNDLRETTNARDLAIYGTGATVNPHPYY